MALRNFDFVSDPLAFSNFSTVGANAVATASDGFAITPSTDFSGILSTLPLAYNTTIGGGLNITMTYDHYAETDLTGSATYSPTLLLRLMTRSTASATPPAYADLDTLVSVQIRHQLAEGTSYVKITGTGRGATAECSEAIVESHGGLRAVIMPDNVGAAAWWRDQPVAMSQDIALAHVCDFDPASDAWVTTPSLADPGQQLFVAVGFSGYFFSRPCKLWSCLLFVPETLAWIISRGCSAELVVRTVCSSCICSKTHQCTEYLPKACCSVWLHCSVPLCVCLVLFVSWARRCEYYLCKDLCCRQRN